MWDLPDSQLTISPLIGKLEALIPLTAPNDVICGLSLRKIGQLGRLFSVVEELIHRDFEGAGKLLQRLNTRNCVAIFDTGHVATEQSCLLLNIAL